MTDSIAVLTAAVPVGDEAVEEVLRRLGAGAPRRLRPGVVEIDLPGGTGAAPDALRDGLAVDVNLVPAARRPARLLIADMDSTIIEVECIDELADFAGVKPQVAAITEAAMRGELDFEGAIDARVALLEGLPVSALQECYDQRVRVTAGAEALVAGMRGAGARTALVSGGFTFFTERVAARVGFDHHQANTLEIAGERLTGTVRRPILGQAAKLEALQALTREAGLTPADAVAIGDGANDLAMVRAAGLGVAFRAKPALRAAAGAVLDHSDLTAVLALQGLPVPG